MKKCDKDKHQYQKRRIFIFASENGIEKQLVRCVVCGSLAFSVHSGDTEIIIEKFLKRR